MRRWLLAGTGVSCVGVAALGVVVPGLPTTIFLIVASWCFVRSCPWLEQRLLRNRVFAPYMRYVDGGAPMPMRARVTAIAMMWACVAVSVTVLAVTGRLDAVTAGVIVALAGVGTAALLTWRRRPRAAAATTIIRP